MTELERALVLLAEDLAFPAAPDVSERVLARLAEPARPRRRRRALVLVLAVLAVAIGAAMAVPQARTAILELFRLRGATVERVETLPAVPVRTAEALRLGREATPAELEGALVPAVLGDPDAVYASTEPYGSRLTLVYAPGDGIPESPYTGAGLLVGQFRGEGAVRFVEKMVGGGTEVEVLQIGPYPALWIEGGPHTVLFDGDTRVFEDRGRLAGNTLLVERNDVLVRIEGELSRERAIEIAESLE
ncbi:MAG TPA: hypothetical protein VD769_03445 [Gaiellaceae bacterium]|nr:hypothetical protein [Gaiellaceae bacterium]